MRKKRASQQRKVFRGTTFDARKYLRRFAEICRRWPVIPDNTTAMDFKKL
jgi:hypothetical protein